MAHGREHSRKLVDLTGDRYGSLTVLERAGNVGARTAWRCRCDCGNIAVIKSHHLRSGHTKTCGRCSGADRSDGLPGLHYVDGTCVEMLAKRPVRKNNTSGATGVEWRASKNSWRATICFKGKRQYLGSYKDFGDAVKARKRAEEELFEAFLEDYARQGPGTGL